MTTASALKDAFLTNLSAASVLGPGQVSTNYSVLESTSACCCVVAFRQYTGTAMAFGNPQNRLWQFSLELFLKDTGDPVTLMNQPFAIVDKVIATLKSDDTLQGQANGIASVEANMEPGFTLDVGGATWIPIDMTVSVNVWDG
jgi:hypothetical protein